MKKRMRTVDGRTATRRVKWFQPRRFIQDGVEYTNCFVYFEITFGEEPYRLVYAGAQLGIDMKRRIVLPGSQVLGQRMDYFVGFNIGVPVARLYEAVNDFGNELNRQTKEFMKSEMWWTPAGIQRGEIRRGLLENEEAYSLRLNPVHVV